MPDKAFALKHGDWSDAGKTRLLSIKGEPLVFAEWCRVLFLHYEIEPSVVNAQLPPSLGTAAAHPAARPDLRFRRVGVSSRTREGKFVGCCPWAREARSLCLPWT